MAKIAIDVALMLPENIAEDAIEINKKTIRNSDEGIKLDKENCVPHMTLAMGCVGESDLADIKKLLPGIVKKYLPINLKILKISSSDEFSSFEIEKTKKLQQLHEIIMEKLKPFLSFEVIPDMLYSPTEINELTLKWIRNFSETSTFENFYPHITLGYSKVQDSYHAKDFTVSKLAVYQLGNYCTCRKALFSLDF